SNEISGTLKPQLALGISLLNGAIELKAGIQIENTLDVNLSIGNGTECKKIDQLSVNNTLSGNVGFFVESFEAPVFKFPTFKL
ncbi:4297_t:CDS:1, partial [Scutellospora calospora]